MMIASEHFVSLFFSMKLIDAVIMTFTVTDETQSTIVLKIDDIITIFLYKLLKKETKKEKKKIFLRRCLSRIYYRNTFRILDFIDRFQSKGIVEALETLAWIDLTTLSEHYDEG